MKCDICGKDCEGIVCASTVGPISFCYCMECFNDGKEPYQALVSYIACAGRYPDDINEVYRKLVKQQLALHNISEEQFTKDVDKAIKEMGSNVMTGFNFRAYLRNYEILQVIGANKTRKQFKNFLRVLYGKKKDRGHIKSKVEKQIKENANIKEMIFEEMAKRIPIIGQGFYW